jgi:DNA-binding NarL/FixJ family response regulator
LSKYKEIGKVPKMSLLVVITDDHPVVRSGYKRLLSLENDIEVIAEFDNGEDTYAWFQDHEADVLIMDISMPGQGGLETLKRLRAKKISAKIIMLSMYDNPTLIQQALDFGANGFLSKSSEPDELINAISYVMNDEVVISKDLAEQLESSQSANGLPHEQLSSREFGILLKLAEGANAKDIAAQFHLSPKTVYNYQTQIYKKLNIENGVQLTQYAIQNKLLKSN